MSSRPQPPKPVRPNVTIRVSGKLFQGHISYLDQLVQSAHECRLWPMLSLANLEELDRPALLYLVEGENRTFTVAACPYFIRQWIDNERDRTSVA
jgi:hypothetical protein